MKATKGNRKLGPHVITVSTLPGPPEVGGTCPGASEWCREHCYAQKFPVMWPNVAQLWEDNTKDRDIELPESGIFRFHTSGDFDSVEYIEKMTEQIKQRPNLRVFAFTRSWQLPELRQALMQMARLPNVQMFASLDESMTGLGMIPRSWRRAWIAGDKRIDPETTIICPETKVGLGKIDCETCQYCIRPPSNGKKHVAFLAHR